MGSISGSRKDQGNEVDLMNVTAQKQIVPHKVLVTGASGLLGVAAIEKFRCAGWEVVSISRRKPELP
jgi:NADP-dependent 3-hydroxy acid dehydrogenase YdfG